MTVQEILKVIEDNFLCVRRLPFKVISHWTYREGDETKKWVDSEGNPSKAIKTVVVREDGKKLLREERDIEKGGWWYVKPAPHTDSTIRFNRKYDKFFAPTLEEAVQLYINMKTSKEILEILRENYSVSNVAYGEWCELEKDFKFSEAVELAEKARNEAYQNWINHPGYKDANLRDEEYYKLGQIWRELPRHYDLKEKEILNHLGLGEIEEVEQYGGEGQGDNWYSVKHFKDHNVYIQTDGYYQSYNGTDFYGDVGYEVFPVQVTKTEYSSKKIK